MLSIEQEAPTRIPEILRDLEAAILKGGREAADAFELYTAPEYVFTSPSGMPSSREDVLDGLHSGDVRFGSYRLSDIDVRPYGSMAVVLGRADGEGKNPGGEIFHGAYRFTSVWHLVEGDWRLVAWQTTAIANDGESQA